MHAAPRWVLVVLVVILALLALTPLGATASSSDGAIPRSEFRFLPGVGLARELPSGLQQIRLEDGELLRSHGPDPWHVFGETVRAGARTAWSPAARRAVRRSVRGSGKVLGAVTTPGTHQCARIFNFRYCPPDLVDPNPPPTDPPHCVPSNEPHFQVLYGYPVDAENRYSSRLGPIRDSVARMNAIVGASADPGWEVDYRVLCSEGGEVAVNAFQGPRAVDATFSSIVSAAKAAGFNMPSTAKFLIYWDGRVFNYGGQAQFHRDSSRSVEASHNRLTFTAPRYAIVYSSTSPMVAAHETGHNMGAVQFDAPHSTGAAHCTDEADVMCYADGGPNGSSDDMQQVCPSEEWDCRRDDYFANTPPERSYLATHWNIGWAANRFLDVAPP